LTFAHAADKVGDDDSGRSHMPTDDSDQFGAERLHPQPGTDAADPPWTVRSLISQAESGRSNS